MTSHIRYLLADSDYGVFNAESEQDLGILYDLMSYKRTAVDRPVHLSLVPDSIKTAAIGDAVFCAEALVVSRKAKDCLVEEFSDYCDFLETLVSSSNGEFYILNVKNVLDCLDLSRSEVVTASTKPEVIMSIRQAVFDADSVGDSPVFKLVSGPYTSIFVNEYFQSFVAKSGLVGFRFEPLSYYENPANLRR